MPFTRFATQITLAAAATLTLSSGAFALMVGDQDVSDEDLPAVSRYCAELAEADATGSSAVDETPVGDAGEVDDSEAQAQDGVADAPASNADAAAEAAVDRGDTKAGDVIDFDAITLKQCQDALLV